MFSAALQQSQQQQSTSPASIVPRWAPPLPHCLPAYPFQSLSPLAAPAPPLAVLGGMQSSVRGGVGLSTYNDIHLLSPYKPHSPVLKLESYLDAVNTERERKSGGAEGARAH